MSMFVQPITSTPLNEPAGFDGDDVLTVVKQYWKDSYGNIRYPYDSSTESNTVELIHDMFQSLSDWDGFIVNGYDGVTMDTHIYQMFSDELPTTIPNTSRKHAVTGLASRHHEAESHHHHHKAGSFLRHVHRDIMALGLWEGCAVAFILSNVKELLPDGSVLQVYHHHEAESHHHHHKAGSFLRHVHHAIMALGLWEGCAVAFVLTHRAEVLRAQVPKVIAMENVRGSNVHTRTTARAGVA
ncbi:hypothetical protein BDR05DRAFT_1005832 [Suillus weaverae]|nr:hypothetical protein BDR05DRAFT_1005832 [Suillus weaverae]